MLVWSTPSAPPIPQTDDMVLSPPDPLVDAEDEDDDEEDFDEVQPPITTASQCLPSLRISQGSLLASARLELRGSCLCSMLSSRQDARVRTSLARARHTLVLADGAALVNIAHSPIGCQAGRPTARTQLELPCRPRATATATDPAMIPMRTTTMMMMMGRVRCARAHLPLPHTWLRLNLLVAQLNRGISHKPDRRLVTQTLSYPQWSVSHQCRGLRSIQIRSTPPVAANL